MKTTLTGSNFAQYSITQDLLSDRKCFKNAVAGYLKPARGFQPYYSIYEPTTAGIKKAIEEIEKSETLLSFFDPLKISQIKNIKAVEFADQMKDGAIVRETDLSKAGLRMAKMAHEMGLIYQYRVFGKLLFSYNPITGLSNEVAS